MSNAVNEELQLEGYGLKTKNEKQNGENHENSNNT